MICLDTRIYIKNRAMIGRSRMYAIINKLAESVMLDKANIRAADEHDKIFIPKSTYEKELWNTCREKTKNEAIKLFNQIKGGKLGGRPKKTIDN